MSHPSICEFRDRMFKLFMRNAEGIPGPDVVKALYQVSHEIWEAGIDRAYEGSGRRTDLTFATSFDLTWLTAVNVELTKLRRKRGLKVAA